MIEMYPLVVLAVTVPVQLKPVLAANAGLAESAMANNGDGVEPDRLLTAFASVVTVSSFAPWKLTDPLLAETLIVFE